MILTSTSVLFCDRSGGQLGSYAESRPGPVLLTDVQTLTAGRPALDCREHPPAERTDGAEIATPQQTPLDGFGGAIGNLLSDRAKVKQKPIGRRQERKFGWEVVARRSHWLTPRYIRPQAPRDGRAKRGERRLDAAKPGQAHQVSQGRC